MLRLELKCQIQGCGKIYYDFTDLADHMYASHTHADVTTEFARLIWTIKERIYKQEHEYERSKSYAVVENGQSIAVWASIETLKELLKK